jgi:hypothetical protein
MNKIGLDTKKTQQLTEAFKRFISELPGVLSEYAWFSLEY